MQCNPYYQSNFSSGADSDHLSIWQRLFICLYRLAQWGKIPPQCNWRWRPREKWV